MDGARGVNVGLIGPSSPALGWAGCRLGELPSSIRKTGRRTELSRTRSNLSGVRFRSPPRRCKSPSRRRRLSQK